MKSDTSFEPGSKVLEFEKNKLLKPKSNNPKTKLKKTQTPPKDCIHYPFLQEFCV
jgi:hypothetical protein